MSSPTDRFFRRAKSAAKRDTDIPDLFVYHVTIELGQPAATVKIIRECYLACDLSPPSWLASHFSNGLKSKPRRFIKTSNGYRLEGRRRDEIAAALGVETTEPQASTTLDKLEALIPAGAKREFLHETGKCFRAGAYRATVVMCWNLALHHLQDHVLVHNMGSFNQALAANKDTRVKIKAVATHDDFCEMPEGKFLEFCRAARIITSSMYNKLKGRLDDRNGAAHPSGVTTTPKSAEAYVEDMIENVLLKFAA